MISNKLKLSLFFFITCILIITPLSAADVGYYDMSMGEGNPTQVAAINTAGHTPVLLTDLTAADLTGIDILLVQNPSNGSYGAEYLSRLADINAAVNSGMILIIHDRYVSDAETILPNGAGFNVLRDFTNDADIDILDNTTLVTNGPGGVLDDNSLDNGTSSTHGYTEASSLPPSAVLILSTTNATDIVTFSYPYGSGWVIYSSIPLDFYLSGYGPNPPQGNFADIYAPNVIAYADSLIYACTAPEITKQPDDQTINYGETATLSINVRGSDPLGYQWYKGNSGDTGSPVPGAKSQSFTTPVLEDTTSYWVKVENECGSDRSNTATITILFYSYPPTGLTLTRVENNYIFYKKYVNRLSWQNNDMNIKPIVTYKIFKKVKGNGDDTYQLAAEVNGNTFQYEFRGLGKDELYTYRIIAVNSMGTESDPVETGN